MTQLTFAEHAEAWWTEQGKIVPANHNSQEWHDMYEKWAEFAFRDFIHEKN
jgi:hypothetical protein